ncbi:MAG: tRNA (adenosine(37)-N6)-threonylcarbamoyltransferase complex dimerization subunit type 1 TsaB [Alphaproteobacteria bacterium]
MTRILAFDTAAETCSALLWENGKTLSFRSEPMKWGHATALMGAIEAVLSEAQLEYKDLDALAVTLGPGGFTGVRVGIATAKGIALAIQRPVWGISSFEALLAQIPMQEKKGKDVLIMLESRRLEPFFQLFDAQGSALTPPSFAKAEDILDIIKSFFKASSLLIAGNYALNVMTPFAEKQRTEVVLREFLPNALSLPDLVMSCMEQNKKSARLQPLYIRRPDISLSKKKTAK